MMFGLRVLYVILALLVVTLVLLPIQLVAILCGHPLMRRLPRWWHRFMCKVLGIKVTIHGHLTPERPLLLVSNHVSWKDILVLGSVADVVYIAKTEVRSWPLIGWLARLQRSVFVERQQRRETGTQISQVSERLLAGELVVLFAEGTTSDGNRVMPFNSSLFGAASAALPHTPEGKVFIQPVSLAYTRLHGMPMGRYHRPIAGWPGDVTLGPHLLRIIKLGALDVEVIFSEPIVFDANAKRKQIAHLVETRVREGLNDALYGKA